MQKNKLAKTNAFKSVSYCDPFIVEYNKARHIWAHCSVVV